ncbi:hypothetical protein GJ496_000950 [Pomphorhynchus laevis]|nr:hypothetical protein GJ496_000950 [Pomphorhynchus laevis]
MTSGNEVLTNIRLHKQILQELLNLINRPEQAVNHHVEDQYHRSDHSTYEWNLGRITGINYNSTFRHKEL